MVREDAEAIAVNKGGAQKITRPNFDVFSVVEQIQLLLFTVFLTLRSHNE